MRRQKGKLASKLGREIVRRRWGWNAQKERPGWNFGKRVMEGTRIDSTVNSPHFFHSLLGLKSKSRFTHLKSTIKSCEGPSAERELLRHQDTCPVTPSVSASGEDTPTN